MIFQIDLWSMLIDIPTFQLILNFLATVLDDFRVAAGWSMELNDVEYWRVGCEAFAEQICTIKPSIQ